METCGVDELQLLHFTQEMADMPPEDFLRMLREQVTLKAVAVNKYHKVSNMLEVKYKIEAKPFPLSAYDPAEDQIGKIRLYATSLADFQKEYGEGTLKEEFKREGFTGGMRTYE